MKDREVKLLAERIERFRSEKEQLQAQLEDKDIQLQSALEKAGQASTISNNSDANSWWAYVWHELKKQGQLGLGSGAGDNRLNSSNENDSSAHNARQKESLRAQAIEIVQARQVCAIYTCLIRRPRFSCDDYHLECHCIL